MDFFRLPKFFCYLWDAQQEPSIAGVKCFIANYWTENSPSDVTVYTNAEEVRLVLNGREIARKTAEREEGIHFPVVFENVPFEKGILKAEAIIQGKVLKTHEIRTPEKAVSLRLIPQFAEEREWIADGADLLMVHAELVDANGTVVPDAEPVVFFSVEGDAEIVGERETWVQADKIQAEAGITGVLLRAGFTVGKVRLIAKAEGIQDAVLQLELTADKKKYVGGVVYQQPEKMPVYTVDNKELFSKKASDRESQSSNWDIGVGKRATCSSFAEGKQASNANQKTMKNPWIAKDNRIPQWWACDLEEKYFINGVAVSWEKDGLWYDYKLETSLDGENWICQYEGNASGQTRAPNRFVSEVKARFVRVVVLGVSGGNVAGIYHVEIFGNLVK